MLVTALAPMPLVAADGVWTNTAGGSWPTTTNWLAGTVADGTDAIADFSTLDIAANATVTLDGARTVGTLVFGDATTASNDWTLNTGSGGPLTLAVTAGTPTINVVNRTATIAAVIDGTQGLQKTGAGTLALTGANTYSGLTSVDAGTLILRTNNNSATSGFSVAAGATLRLGNLVSLGATQNITGAGNVAKDTAFFGDSTIAGTNNNYTGTTDINVSQLTLAAGGVINGTSAVSIQNSNNAALLNNGSITTAGAFTMTGGNATSGILTNSATGVLNVGSFSMAANSRATNAGTITNAGAFTANGTFTSTGALTTGALTVGGTFTLGASSTFTNTAGTVVINSGGLASFGNASHLSSIAANGITINSGGAFSAAGSVSSVLGSGKILNTSAGAIALSGDSSENINFTGFNTLGLAAAGTAVYSGTITPTAGGYRFGGNAASNLTVTSALGDANTVTQSGLGFTTLAAANTYSGTTTVTGGTLAIGNAGSINGGAVSITGGTWRSSAAAP